MMNPHRGDVSFEVAGKTYTMRLSHAALIKVEEALNKNLSQVMTEMSSPDTMRLGTVVVLVWAGLQKHHPTLTQEDVANLFDEMPGGVQGMVIILDKAFSKAFETTLGTKGTDPTQKPGIGINSSSSMSPLDTAMAPSGISPQRN